MVTSLDTTEGAVLSPALHSTDPLLRLPVTEENDTILIATTGAYGYSMSSHYNMRSPPNQLLLKSLSK